MKFLSILAVGAAGLAIQASAAPVRVIEFITSSSEKDVDGSVHALPFRVGMAGAHPVPTKVPIAKPEGNEWFGFPMELPADLIEELKDLPEWKEWKHPEMMEGVKEWKGKGWKKGKHGGCKKGLLNKFNTFANKFRKIMGLPEIEHHRHGHWHHSSEMFASVNGSVIGVQKEINEEGVYRILPIIGTEGIANVELKKLEHNQDGPHHNHEGHGRFRHHHNGLHHGHHRSFGHRLMKALYILGPVEGRIVAFVLGLGIGALIRVVYMFCLLVFRATRCNNQEGRIVLIEIEEDAEPLLSEKAPQYSAVPGEGEETVSRN